MEESAGFVQMANGHIALVHGDLSFEIDPKLGARIVSAKIDDSEVLLQEREGPVNWGSTFWLAPQSLWNWPPPAAVHLGNYSFEIAEGRAKFIGQVDNQFGVRVVKYFQYLEETGCLEIQYEIINETDSPVQYGPWEVTVVPADGSSVFFVPGDDPAYAKSNLVFEDHDKYGWFSYDHAKSEEWHKIFNNAKEGWLAHTNIEGYLFVKNFEVVPADMLARKQGNVEVYVNKEFRYIELENHGRYTSLDPGETLKYKVRWYLTRLPSSIAPDEYSEELINFVRKLINT